MKKKDLDAIRKKDIKNLKNTVIKDKVELRKLTSELSAGNSKNIKKIRELRLNIAQGLTVIREKELVEDLIKKTKKEESKK